MLMYAIMSDSLIVEYVLFVIIQIEVCKVISREIKGVCVAKLPHSFWNEQ